MRNIRSIGSRVLVEADIVAILVVNDNCIFLLVWHEYRHLTFRVRLISSILPINRHDNRNALPCCTYILDILGSRDDYLLHTVLIVRQIFYIDIAATQYCCIANRSDRLRIAVLREHYLIIVSSVDGECSLTLCVGGIALRCLSVVEEHIDFNACHVDRINGRCDGYSYFLIRINNIYRLGFSVSVSHRYS